jgi:antitoxin CptB
MTDDVDNRRRRALYRAAHRGTKEMDWMLGRFAESALPAMALPMLADFEELLALPDPVIEGLLLDPKTQASGPFARLIRDMRAFHGLESTN